MNAIPVGIALGSGASRGWAHIGVLLELAERGIRADVICGASVGSLVAAAYASEQLDVLEGWVRGLTRMDILRLLDTGFRGGGFMTGTRVMTAVGTLLADKDIETLPVRFGAVATDLSTGREVWLREGPMLTAVRASSGLPGLFSPMQHKGSWLIDGGVVNPVPVSMCHALGAEVVIAVNLNADLVRRRTARPVPKPKAKADKATDDDSMFGKFAGAVSSLFRSDGEEAAAEPGIFDVVGASINIMQERITRSRMAGEPPELVITPKVGDFQLMDFHRAGEAIAAGRQAVEAVEPQLVRLRSMIKPSL